MRAALELAVALLDAHERAVGTRVWSRAPLWRGVALLRLADVPTHDDGAAAARGGGGEL